MTDRDQNIKNTIKALEQWATTTRPTPEAMETAAGWLREALDTTPEPPIHAVVQETLDRLGLGRVPIGDNGDVTINARTLLDLANALTPTPTSDDPSTGERTALTLALAKLEEVKGLDTDTWPTIAGIKEDLRRRIAALDRDQRPHSRACGITRHDHGPDCHSNCPTCHGR